MTHDEYQKLCDDLMRGANKSGQTVELGWLALRKMWVPASAPDYDVQMLRRAFFAGAQHLYASIMRVMDDDREPTANDMAIMARIDKELGEWAAHVVAETYETKGNA